MSETKLALFVPQDREIKSPYCHRRWERLWGWQVRMFPRTAGGLDELYQFLDTCGGHLEAAKILIVHNTSEKELLEEVSAKLEKGEFQYAYKKVENERPGT